MPIEDHGATLLASLKGSEPRSRHRRCLLLRKNNFEKSILKGGGHHLDHNSCTMLAGVDRLAFQLTCHGTALNIEAEATSKSL